MMKNNLNLTTNFCIQNYKQFNDILKYIEKIREDVSFFNFTSEEKTQFFGVDLRFTFDEITYENIIVDKYYFFASLIKTILYIIMIGLSIIGNMGIMFIIIFRTVSKSGTNNFILNLTICNFGILFSSAWVHLLKPFTGFWLLGESFCKLNSYFQMVSIVAMVLSLSLILLDRYIGIVYPLNFNLKITHTKSFYLIAGVWLVSLLVSIPTYKYRTYTERKWSDFTEKICDDYGWPVELMKYENSECISQIYRPLKRVYYTCLILVLFFLPVITMLVTFTKIIKKILNDNIIGEFIGHRAEKLLAKRKKIIIKLIILLIIFMICWMPLQGMLLYMEYAIKFPKWWTDFEWLCYFMAYSNTAINPFLYAGISENYQKGLKQLNSRFITNPSSKKYMETPPNTNAIRMISFTSHSRVNFKFSESIKNVQRNDSHESNQT